MAKAKTVWGIDIGQMALKALKLRNVEGQLFVEAFDVIEHPKMLCQDDADAEQLVSNSLAQFLARNSVSGCEVAIAIPGRSSFTRFVKLPPVEKSKIPDIVQFEAGQQIPFPIPDVVWRYQTFEDPDSPDVEVGLFAVKRADVFEALAQFTMAGVPVDMVQMAPLALYNFMLRDQQIAMDGATILADVGVDKTDLVVADGARIWMRTIQIGGNNFTHALEKSFKLSFAKAEKLKRSAATNKYARQVFQAMRPVFADLVQEIQRSIGYYTQKHRDTKFTRLIGLGNGFRLPGLQKFLERNLNIPVARIDSYNELSPSHNVNMPVFTENVLSFAVAYGLALQAVGTAPISTNLLPREVARRRCWDKKRLWFAGAAAAMLLAAVVPMYRATADGNTFDRTTAGAKQAKETVRIIKDQTIQWNKENTNTKTIQDEAWEYVRLYGYRSFWPSVQSLMSDAVAHVTRKHRVLLETKDGRKTLKTIPRANRELIFVESMTSDYLSDLAQAGGDDPGARVEAALPLPRGRGEAVPAASTPAESSATGRGFRIVLTVRTPMNEDNAATKLIRPLVQHIRDNGTRENVFRIQSPSVKWSPLVAPAELGGRGVAPGRGARRGPGRGMDGGPGTEDVIEDTGPQNPSLLFPDEDISDDTRFTITLLVEIAGDGTNAASASGSPASGR